MPNVSHITHANITAVFNDKIEAEVFAKAMILVREKTEAYLEIHRVAALAMFKASTGQDEVMVDNIIHELTTHGGNMDEELKILGSKLKMLRGE